MEAFIEEILGFPPPKMCGWTIAVKVYTRNSKDESSKYIVGADGKPTSLLLPETVSDNDQYKSDVGLIISMGPYCFTGGQYEGHDRNLYPKVGQWIHFAKTGLNVLYRGISLRYINDNAVKHPVDDPTYIQII